MAESVGDMLSLDMVPAPLGGMRVEVPVDGSQGRCVGEMQSQADPGKGLARTVEGIGSGSVANLFATDSVLLVVERERRSRDGVDIAQVIQRTVRGGHYAVVKVEGDVAVAKGLGASFRCVGVDILSGAEEPEEGGDDEVDNVGVEDSKDFMIPVKDGSETPEDGGVDRVGSGCWVVLVSESLEVRPEYRVESSGSIRRLSGIWFTQVGYPLANGKEGLIHCVTSDRVRHAVTVGVDEEVADLVSLVRDITEGWISPEGATEAGPLAKLAISAFGGLGDNTRVGGLESSAEISLELKSGLRCNSVQGADCG